MSPEPLSEFILVPHDLFEIARRGLTEAVVRRVLAAPEDVFEVRPGRCVFQARVPWEGGGETYLVRVFVDVDRTPAEVVTVYRTSKIAKYRRAP